MKKTTLLFCFMTCIILVGYSQYTTSYGVGAGTEGEQNSFFGHLAGSSPNPPYSKYNTAIGANAMYLHTASSYNTAIGAYSLGFGGQGCTANGYYALRVNSYHPNIENPGEQGYYNTAIGFKSMYSNIIGDYNTAVGAESLYFNVNSYNSAFGYHALRQNSTGELNTAIGSYSMKSNTNGKNNTATGSYSMSTNTTGSNNTGNGYYSLYSNATGEFNTALGTRAMYSNINGSSNTATGYYALNSSNFGAHNTAGGFRALYSNTTGNYNTAEGSFALGKVVSGSYNSALGYNAGPGTEVHLDNTTAIGYLAVPTASNQVRLGNTSVTSIGGQVGWTAFSDGRFKKDIKEDVSGLDFINELRPVSYTVDKAGLNKFLHVNDSSSNQAEVKSVPTRQTGFVAQEVEAIVKKTGYVFSGVDAPENENDPYGIRYAAFVVPLVKGMQELSAKVEAQQQQIQLLLAALDSKTESAVTGTTSAALLQNSPNPFDAETVIQMTLPDDVGTATVMIYNLEGKQMKNIQLAERGDVTVKISGNELAAGMYLYSLIADGKVVDTKRMVLTR